MNEWLSGEANVAIYTQPSDHFCRSESNSPSLTPPQGNSRSSSPSSHPSGTGNGPQQRIVSGSIKDRIAKFNNPSAPPPIPKQHFAKGLGAGNSQEIQRRGLVGNRIPSLDPKTAGMINTGGGSRRISENRGLIGNRIPSMGSQGNVNPVTGQLTGTSTGGNSGNSGPGTPIGSSTAANAAGGPKPATARSASPAGSIDSSVVSGTVESSTSPITSRSSSPPTSPGASTGGVPPNLLSATLPHLDDSGAGAATPSSTRAEAGDTVSELSLSVPSTPTATGTPPLPAPEYDLVAPNLKLATANAAANAGSTSSAGANIAHNPMVRGLSSQSAASRAFAPSISSSLATQSRGSEEETQMMQDVSGVSTPMGTPRAARRELGEGSVVGEGSVMGDNDVEELGQKLENLEVDKEDQEGTPEPPKEEQEPDTAKIASHDYVDVSQAEAEPETGTGTAMDVDVATETEESSEPQTPISTTEKDVLGTHSKSDQDPNKASDLADLKAGDLEYKASSGKREKEGEPSEVVGLDVPANALAGDALTQNIAEHEISASEKKEQGGEAGQRMEDVETADEVILPEEEIKVDAGLEVREATPVVVGPDEKETKEGGNKGVAGSTQWFESSNSKQEREGEGKSSAVNTEGEAPDEPSSEGPQPEAENESGPTDSNEQDTDGKSQVASTEIEQNEASRTEKRDHPIVFAENQPEPDVSKSNPSVRLQSQPEPETESQPEPKGDSTVSTTTTETERKKGPQLGMSYVDEKIGANEIKQEDVTVQEPQPSPPYESEPEPDTQSKPEPEPKIVEDADTAPPLTSDEPVKVDKPATQASAATKPEAEVSEPQSLGSGSATSPTGQDVDPAQDLETKTNQPAVAAIGAEIEKGDVAPSGGKGVPKQLHLEPAPIAQPADAENDDGESTPPASVIDTDKTPAAEIDPPTFPTPPTADPDVEDPISSTPSEAGSDSGSALKPNEKVINIPAPPKGFNDASDVDAGAGPDASTASTPVDEAFLKSFPVVPDEEKPRVEVHVSSPVTTPQKAKRISIDPDTPLPAHRDQHRSDDDGGDDGEEDDSVSRRRSSEADDKDYPQTPVASLPGHSKSLSHPELYQDSNTAGSVGSMSGSASSNELDPDATPQASRNLSKRMSTRRSPKSPLLDDEDPGDFEPGEGWAVVTK
ncbi:hypothetical protein IAU59_006819 [Kwoniella sp. CBS 9459]